MDKIAFVTRGCSKNLVDSEVLAGLLTENGLEIVSDPQQSDYTIVNTCGFIDKAREESVDTILEVCELKNQGIIKKVLVMGCLSQKYSLQLKKEIPEIDRVYGLKEFNQMLRYIVRDKKLKVSHDSFSERLSLENSHYAYIRISDGCNHNCSYCSIPSMRGKFQSRQKESILSEIETLQNKGVKEFILIGQEISSYGEDIYKENEINILLENISEIVDDKNWIRLLYSYPPKVNKKFIRTIQKLPNVCNYLDFPIEHSETSILKAMFRKDTRESLLKKIKMMRDIIPDIVLRTSLILGFPGEDENIYQGLLKFLEEVKFDRVGCFAYSPEPFTKAFDLPMRPPRDIAQSRLSEVMKLAADISWEQNQKYIGESTRVLIDRKEGDYFVGRTYRDAPEIDNEILVKTDDLNVGEFYNVEIETGYEFDLYGKLL